MDHSGHNMEEGAVMNDPVTMETTTTGHSEHTTGGDNGGHDMTMSMAMTFQAGYKQVILFDIWKTETVGAMIGAVAIVFVLAALYEGLKVFREHLLIQAQSRIATSVPVQPTSVRQEKDGSVIFLNNKSSCENDMTPSDGLRMCSIDHVLQTVLHLIQVTVSYILMLIAMTYNVWLCIGVVFGAAAGYFCFGWKRSVGNHVHDSTEHCQ